jgi:archaellum biogenesis protein FlaJ (TadC family)
MTLILYLTCFFVALIGMALQVALKIKALNDKALAANICFKTTDFFKQDYWSLIASILTIVLFLFFLTDILKWQPAVINYVKIGFAFIGYTGSDIASRLFSVVNGKINDVINAKSNTADGGSDPVTSLPK